MNNYVLLGHVHTKICSFDTLALCVSFGIIVEDKPRIFAFAFLAYEPLRESFSLGVKTTDVKGDVKVGRKRRRAEYEGGRGVVNTDSNLDSHG